MQLIARQELTSAAASITFSSIPGTFTDLYLVLLLRRDSSSGTGTLKLNFNGVTTSTYSSRRLEGTGSAVSSDSQSGATFIRIGQVGNSTNTADTFTSTAIYLPNYTASAAKSASSDSVTENNGTDAYQNIIAGLWSVTDAVTSLEIAPEGSGSFVSASSATLYGILAGSDGIVTVS
jgi:hypothetical protein